jgi:hypothetical protein
VHCCQGKQRLGSQTGCFKACGSASACNASLNSLLLLWLLQQLERQRLLLQDYTLSLTLQLRLLLGLLRLWPEQGLG